MMTGWYAERTPDRSAKAVMAVTVLALLLVAGAMAPGAAQVTEGHPHNAAMRHVSLLAG